MSCVRLEIKGFHIPGKKNRNRFGKNGAFIDPEVKKRINEIVDSFEYQLLSAIPTDESGTITTQQLRSWTASSLPDDDCWALIPNECYSTEFVPKGQEGCVVTVESINTKVSHE